MLQRPSLGGFRVKSSPYFPPKNRTILICSRITNCLVVTVTMEFYDFPFSWEFHHHWRTHSIIFQVGVGWNHQPAQDFPPYLPILSKRITKIEQSHSRITQMFLHTRIFPKKNENFHKKNKIFHSQWDSHGVPRLVITWSFHGWEPESPTPIRGSPFLPTWPSARAAATAW